MVGEVRSGGGSVEWWEKFGVVGEVRSGRRSVEVVGERNEDEVDAHGTAKHKPECEMCHQHQGGRTPG